MMDPNTDAGGAWRRGMSMCRGLALMTAVSCGFAMSTAGTAAAQADKAGLTHEEMRTGDGSRFLLVSDPGSAVIHWAIATPAGDLIDPPGYPGLATAVTRASLSGTDTVGTRDWTEESKALRKLELLEAERLDFIAKGGQPGEQLLADAERTRRQLESIRDEGEWLRELRAAPTEGVELIELSDACVFRLTTLPESFATVAYMLMDRRENARLRTVDEDYRAVLAERGIEDRSDEARLHRELREQAYFALAPRNADDLITQIDRSLANATFQRTQNPAAAYHVIVGGFEIEEMRKLLERQFTVSNLEDSPAPVPEARRRGRSRRSTIDTRDRAGVAIAFELLPDRPIVEQRVAAEWLAGGTTSNLAISLRTAGYLGVEPVIRMPFPLSARPGFVLVEFWQSTNPMLQKPTAELASVILDAIKGSSDQVEQGAIQAATARAALRLDVDRADPAQLASWLAIECGVRGRKPAAALRPAPAQVDWMVQKQLVDQLFNGSNRIIVEMEKAR